MSGQREPRPAVQYLASIRAHPYVKELEARLRLACEPCAECGHIDWRELDDVLTQDIGHIDWRVAELDPRLKDCDAECWETGKCSGACSTIVTTPGRLPG